MSNLTELQVTLENTTPKQQIVLDDRTIEKQLRLFYQYCQLIPFDAEHTWADVFFNKESDLIKLAVEYLANENADGLTPSEQTFILAFLRMLEIPRALLNTFPGQHREIYYQQLLGLKPYLANADRVVLSFTPNAEVTDLMLSEGTLFDGGQDIHGTAVQYALERNILINHGYVSELYWTNPDISKNKVKRYKAYSILENLPLFEEGVRLFSEQVEEEVVVTGRIIGSSLLSMSGGERYITLTFKEDIDPADIVEATISSYDNWLPLAIDTTINSIAQKKKSKARSVSKTITYFLSKEQNAITPPIAQEEFSEITPLIRLGRKDGKAIPEITNIKVSVKGLADVTYSTDEGINRIEDTSYPFSHEPILGRGFNLATADWYNKSNSEITVTLHPQWLDLPDQSFKDWYQKYDKSPVTSNDIFKVKASIGSTLGIASLDGDSSSLFTGAGKPESQDIKIKFKALSGQKSDSNDPKDNTEWLHLELAEQDFLYNAYWQQVVTNPDINPPYIPQIKSWVIDWEIENSVPELQYILTPFGYQDAKASIDEQITTNSILYLGITDIYPNQDLNLYWKLLSPQKLTISWQYLNNNNSWLPINAQVEDHTNNLFFSGEWKVTLPEDISSQAPTMPKNRCWLRAVITPLALDEVYNSSGYPQLYNVYANSAIASLMNSTDLDDSHFNQPLPAGTITQSSELIEGLDTILQPWSSFAGYAAESAEEFNQRVAKRLSHRQRALTWQDMSTLLKEQYPEVFDVHIPTLEELGNQPITEQQILLVIPVNSQRDNTDALRPVFSPARLETMQNYLQSLASLWTNIQIRNPTYFNVVVNYEIQFNRNVNIDYGYRQLQLDLTKHYMPWSQLDDKQGVILGNHLDYYDMVAWIQQLSYVNQVQKLTLNGEKASIESEENQVLILVWSETEEGHLQGVSL